MPVISQAGHLSRRLVVGSANRLSFPKPRARLTTAAMTEPEVRLSSVASGASAAEYGRSRRALYCCRSLSTPQKALGMLPSTGRCAMRLLWPVSSPLDEWGLTALWCRPKALNSLNLNMVRLVLWLWCQQWVARLSSITAGLPSARSVQFLVNRCRCQMSCAQGKWRQGDLALKGFVMLHLILVLLMQLNDAGSGGCIACMGHLSIHARHG